MMQFDGDSSDEGNNLVQKTKGPEKVGMILEEL
jgi:hypothetical protein